jgi:hypothetical protein
MPNRFSPQPDRGLMHTACPAAISSDAESAIGHFEISWRLFRMKFLSTNYKKYVAAAVTVFAAIAVPAQATDCTTACQNAASQAGNAAAQPVINDALAYCTSHYSGFYVNSCMNSKVPEIQAAYDQAYNQAYSSCTGSCH